MCFGVSGWTRTNTATAQSNCFRICLLRINQIFAISFSINDTDTYGTPYWIRTNDFLHVKETLWPAELRVHIW